MVKRRKYPNSENQDDLCEENCKPLESLSSSNVAKPTDCTTQSIEPILKESCGTTLTRSKTALQQQHQLGCVSADSVENQDTSEQSCKNSSDVEVSNPASNSPVVVKSNKTSARPNKKVKKDLLNQSPSNQNSSRKGKGVKKRTRRPWEVWSKEDIDNFFDGLCELGKDFDKIHAFIEQRSKKKGLPQGLVKNKDQVRHFYYRTLQKISKHVNLEDGVNKQAQELFVLINYAELRKKLGRGLNYQNEQRLNEFLQKLNDLVHNGTTTVKVKGRKFKMKTPVCRALKKLNNIEDPKFDEIDKGPKLPADIKVLFFPKDNATWARVQRLSMNPRVKLKLGLQKRFSDVLEFLQRRWKPYRLKVRDRLLNSLPSSHQHLDINISDEEKVLKIIPRAPPHANICPVTIKQTDTSSTNQSITIKDFINSPESNKNKKTCKLKSSSSSSSTTDSKDKTLTGANDELPTNVTVTNDENESSLMGSLPSSNQAKSEMREITEALPATDLNGDDVNNVYNCNGVSESGTTNDAGDQYNDLNIENIYSGFTAKNAPSLTIGQLYLMLDKPNVMIFDYEWTNEEEESSCSPSLKQLNHTLKELVRIANISLADLCKLKQNALSSGNVVACSCGHMCTASASTSKNSHRNSNIAKNPARTNVLNRVNSIKTSGTDKCEDAADQIMMLNGPTESDLGETQDPFIKPTHVAPRSSAQVSTRSINIREQVEKFGLNSLRRPGYKMRPTRKALFSQRTLLPKTASNPPVVTVQLMSTANLAPQINQNKNVQNVINPGNSRKNLLRIMPGGPFVDIGSVNVLNSVSVPVTSSTKTEPTPLNSLAPTAGSSKQIPQPPIIQTDLFSIISDTNNGKQLVDHSVISQDQVGAALEKLKPIQRDPEISLSSSSPPRLSIPEHNGNEHTSKLPANITALFNTSLRVAEAPFVEESQKPSDSDLTNCRDSNNTDISEVKLDQVKSDSPAAPVESNVHSTSPDHLVRMSSPVLSTNWLDAENSEYSLSNLLGTFESPIKTPNPVLMHNSASVMSDNSSSLDGIGRLAPDVDTQLQCLMNENSIDYVSKFADLAAHIASSDHKK